MPDMKVAICTDGIFPHSIGGMQRHSKKLIDTLALHHRAEWHVLHPHQQNLFSNELITEHILDGIDNDKNYLSECWKYSKQVSQKLSEIKPDVIYSQGLSVWHNIRQYQPKLVINPHGLEPYQGLTTKDKLVGFPFRQVFDYLFNHCHTVISLGGNLTTILRSRIKDSSTALLEIPNAVDLPGNEHPTFGTPPYRVLFVGRLAANKGVPYLMEAIQVLNRQGLSDRYNYIIAGKGPLYDSYLKQYNYPNVSFLGFVSDEELTNLYQTSDLFILPTLFEGMPTVVLEAMAHGLPIIVSDVGATAELVNDENGYLIEKGNISAIIGALKNFADLSTQKKEAFAKASLAKIENRFNWKNVAGQHFKLFAKIAAN